MKTLLKAFVVLVCLIAAAFAVLVFYVRSIDGNDFRGPVSEILSEKIGRVVRLEGDLSFVWGRDGAFVVVNNVYIMNSQGASRPDMARLGRMRLGVEFWPLLVRHLSIIEVSVDRADILLETNARGVRNWDLPIFGPQGDAQREGGYHKDHELDKKRDVSINIDRVSVSDSVLGVRGLDGSVTVARISLLVMDQRAGGKGFIVKGDVNGVPVSAEVITGVRDLSFLARPFIFDTIFSVGNARAAAKGTIDLAGRRADISAFEGGAGHSFVKAVVKADWSGARPSFRGAVSGPRFRTSDFVFRRNAGGGETNVSGPATGGGGIFSDRLLPFDLLKFVDLDISSSIGVVGLGAGVIKSVDARLVLSGGYLSFATKRALIGNEPVKLSFALDARRAPARMGVQVFAKEAPLGEVLMLAGIPAFMSGTAGASIQLEGVGSSPREIASTLSGLVSVSAQDGQILTGMAAGISTVLAAVLGASGEDNALNCLAARFLVRNGVMSDQGILVDSATATVSAGGQINLGSETIAMLVRARPKMINIGGLIPAVSVEGRLDGPSFSVDASGVARRVIGSLIEGGAGGISGDIPQMLKDPSGKNACVFSLDNATKKTHQPTGNILRSDPVSRATRSLQDMGGEMLKGILGQ